MSKNDNNIHVIEMARYTSPKVLESKRDDFVAYGDDNNYFDFLIQSFLNSTTNNSVITSICNLIFGKGLDALDSNKKPDQYAQMISLFKPKELKKVINDRKILGLGALKIQYKGGKVSKVSHFPMETLRVKKMNDEGEIEGWYYHPNWAEYKKSDVIKEIPIFGSTEGKQTEIYIIKPYVTGYPYYPPVDYQGALPYAKLEDEIADYLINDTLNGFSGTKVVNFNNGIPDIEKQREIKREVLRNLTGSTGEKLIVAFNKNPQAKTTIDDIPLANAPEHYSYLSEEAEKKLLKGHKAPSWLLGANSGGNGLSSNADEIKNQMTVFDNFVIKPYQKELIECFNEILAVNDISLKLYFKTLQPLEFIDTEGMDKETKEEETGVKQDMCSHAVELSKEGQKSLDGVADILIDLGDDDLDGWEEIDAREVDYDNEEELDAEIDAINSTYKPKLSLLDMIVNLTKTGVARPNSRSEQDKLIGEHFYKVRYRYTGNPKPQREFCQKMMSANKLYRKEDIIAMGDKVVNAGWGANGSDKYSIWLYKGGGNCHHKWQRVTFKSVRKGVDVKNPQTPKISTNKAEKEGLRIRNPKEVSMMPKDMPNQGFLNK